MSLERTPPPSLAQTPPPQAAAALVSIEPSACNICNVTMSEGQDCLIISECSHLFHRICIEEYLSSASECPVCKRPCQLSELRSLLIMQKSASQYRGNSKASRGKGRGAMSKQYSTRSMTRNLSQDPHNANFSFDTSLHGTPNRRTVDTGQNNVNIVSQANNTQHIGNPIDYNEINRLIESNLTRLLQNINILPQPNHSNDIQMAPPQVANVNHSSNQVFQNGNTNQQSTSRPPFVGPNGSSQLLNLSPNTFSNSNTSGLPSDKVTSIIQSWNLKFDGSSSGLNVEEFLYRVTSLTNDNFSGDFSVICKNLNTLLTGKAKEWYWRFHKQSPSINWVEFCRAIRSQYKDFKTFFDIREELRNRKQKQNENFDTFFEAISAIMDRLPVPLSDEELVEILPRNLRPEIRQDLLYVKIDSVSHLRQLVQTREHFLNDEYVKKNLAMRHTGFNIVPRRQVADIELDDDVNDFEDIPTNVDALHKPNLNNKCWNCEEIGHHWQDCLQDRRIFCYGCGAKHIYKPNCVECRAKKTNTAKNFKQVGPQRD